MKVNFKKVSPNTIAFTLDFVAAIAGAAADMVKKYYISVDRG